MLAVNHSLSTTPMRCIVVDDEEYTIDHMVEIIGKVPSLELVQTFIKPSEALLFLQVNKIDLVFIDIEMPKLTGVEFIQLAGTQYKYIITSAYPKYAVEGFNLETVDFLHKPFRFERFLKAVHKAQQQIENAENMANNPVIFVKSAGKLKAILLADICWIESLRNSITINTEADRFTSSLTITDIENQLSPTLFTRVHKSFIIANSHINIIDKDTIGISCHTQKVIPIGDLYRKNLTHFIENKIIKKISK